MAIGGYCAGLGGTLALGEEGLAAVATLLCGSAVSGVVCKMGGGVFKEVELRKQVLVGLGVLALFQASAYVHFFMNIMPSMISIVLLLGSSAFLGLAGFQCLWRGALGLIHGETSKETVSFSESENLGCIQLANLLTKIPLFTTGATLLYLHLTNPNSTSLIHLGALSLTLLALLSSFLLPPTPSKPSSPLMIPLVEIDIDVMSISAEKDDKDDEEEVRRHYQRQRRVVVPQHDESQNIEVSTDYGVGDLLWLPSVDRAIGWAILRAAAEGLFIVYAVSALGSNDLPVCTKIFEAWFCYYLGSLLPLQIGKEGHIKIAASAACFVAAICLTGIIPNHAALSCLLGLGCYVTQIEVYDKIRVIVDLAWNYDEVPSVPQSKDKIEYDFDNDDCLETKPSARPTPKPGKVISFPTSVTVKADASSSTKKNIVYSSWKALHSMILVTLIGSYLVFSPGTFRAVGLGVLIMGICPFLPFKKN